MNIIDRIKNIIITPKTEWEKINGEEQDLSTVLMSYVLPLAVAGAIAAFIGFGLIGVDTGILGIKVKGYNWGFYTAIKQFLSCIIAVVVSAYIIDMLAPSFGSEKNINKSAQLVAYAYTPGMIGALLNILPMLAILGGLFGLYGIYLWYLGLGPLKKTPDDKKVIYLVVSILVMAVVFVVIGLILGKILGSIFNIGLLGDYGRFGV